MTRQPIIVDTTYDGKLHLSFGYFQPKTEYSHTETERGYNIFGDPLDFKKVKYTYHRVLRMGDGIRFFDKYEDMKSFLDQMFPNGDYQVLEADLVGKKFYSDRDTLLELSRQS